MRTQTLPPAAALAGFTVWLLAFPMGGALLGPAAGDAALPAFLVPHVVSLYATSRAPSRAFSRWSSASGVLAALVTLLFPLWTSHPAGLLFAAGLFSGPVAVRAGLLLKCDEDPPRQAAWALVAANLLLAGLGALPLPGLAPFAAAALALCAPCFLRAPNHETTRGLAGERTPKGEFLRVLPFLFVFHLVSGLSYGVLMPAYEAVRVLPAVELLFYVLAVLGARRLAPRGTGGVLSGAILLGMLSLGSFRAGSAAAVHLSMFAMQASAGFMDLFVLLTLLRQPEPVRAFGLGLGTVCLGILGGHLASLGAGALPGGIAVLGSMALNLALLVLHWSRRRRGATALPAKGTRASPFEARPPASYRLPPGLGARLSAMERSVLEMVLEGRTFKEAAAALAVSESSVKTYMRRIYEKAEVPGKGALLAKLRRPAPAEEPAAVRPTQAELRGEPLHS